MTKINELASATVLAAGDTLPIWDQDGGDAKQVSLSLLATYLNTALANLNETLYTNAPTTGQTVTVALPSNGNDVWQSLIPAGTLAALTVTLSGTPVNLQEFTLTSTQTVTALTMNAPAGQTIAGGLTTIAANGFGHWKYDATTTTWRRVG